MANRKVRWGVISTANIGRAAVIPAIHASGNCELVAVASRQKQTARDFAEKMAIPGYYGSYQELLNDKTIDAVYNPLPNSLHLEWTIKAAEKGKHILCEKPLGLNAAECEKMQAAAQANGVKLMEAFMYRFHPQTEKVIQLLRSGVLGKLGMIRSVFTFRLTNPDNIRLSSDLGGGALMDVGCYCVNISRTLAGMEPIEVQAFADWGSSGVDEQMVATLRFANGILAQFDCALTMERRENYQVAGTDGYLSIPAAFLPGTKDTVIYEHRGREKVIEHKIKGADEYRLMVEHFADCILNNRSPRYSATEAGLNMRVIEALYRSARNDGRIVKME